MAQKPSIPKGTRDFSAVEVAKRAYIMDTIKSQFELYGFRPIETPSFENSTTLLGKYGEEGDRLIFKILNSGDFLNKVEDQSYKERDSTRIAPQISEKALRYDLTVPFARYVVQHRNEIDFPFKRYQVQPVWRADRPQKGRFREFLQCDADVVGSSSLWQEVEFIQLYDAVFDALRLPGVTLKMNSRKILAGIAEVIGVGKRLIDFTVALDKLDKIGIEGVQKEMLAKGFSTDLVAKVQPLFDFKGTIREKLAQLRKFLTNSPQGLQGVEELTYIVTALEDISLQTIALDIEVTLARGLNYYTGAIFELQAPKTVKMGAIGGGGRYDDLTGIFGLKDISGVGISFGLDRIYLVLEELNLFPTTVALGTKALFINFGDQEGLYAMKAITALRKAGVASELYPDATKMKKQMTYAHKCKIPYVVLTGSAEIANHNYLLKRMDTGTQEKLSLAELIAFLKEN